MLFYTMLTACFLLFCIQQKLMVDLSAGKIESLLVRVLLVFSVSTVIGYRLRQSRVALGCRSISGFLVVLMFIAVLYYPLVSQSSYLAESIDWTSNEITKDYQSGSDKAFALLQKFPALYQRYMDQNLEFSKLFVNLDALVKVYGLRVSPNNNVAVGKNGFFFEGWGARRVEKGIVEKFDNIADYMGQIPFTEDELKLWKRTLEERNFWLKEKGIDYVFALAPTKALVYQEFLPSSLQRAAEGKGTTRYEQLTAYLQNNTDIKFIDLLPPLLEAKSERNYPLLFYKTDFHWNFYGAFVAYQAIIEALQVFYPHYDLQKPELSDFDLSINEHWAHHRFMDMVGLPASLHKNEHYITMIPKEGRGWDSALDLPAKGIYDVYPPKRTLTAENGKTLKIRLIRNPEAPIPSILLLGDSFFEKLVYFFSRDGKRVMNFRTIVNFPDTIFEFDRPTLVIQEILNMFILREPPKNPPGFRASYLRNKYEAGSELFMTRAEDIQKTEESIEINIPQIVSQNLYVEKIARLKIGAHKATKIELKFQFDSGADQEISAENIKKGENIHYFELPNQSVSKVIISTKNYPAKIIKVISLEIRSE